jgi:hypothetical protein
MENHDNLFIRGFNNGYLLAKREPELAIKMIKSTTPNNEYLKGFTSGKQEFEMEKIRQKLKGTSDKKNPSKEITKDKGRGK